MANETLQEGHGIAMPSLRALSEAYLSGQLEWPEYRAWEIAVETFETELRRLRQQPSAVVMEGNIQ